MVTAAPALTGVSPAKFDPRITDEPEAVATAEPGVKHDTPVSMKGSGHGAEGAVCAQATCDMSPAAINMLAKIVLLKLFIVFNIML